ncbi:hypothetical protein [Streptosporangium sp. CA-115845]|uniref:hypothetical protein n=1 Tax=Streptosporangium sp. CA-115845 TaxID=3240071 RepID=UPI003D91E5AE
MPLWISDVESGSVHDLAAARLRERNQDRITMGILQSVRILRKVVAVAAALASFAGATMIVSTMVDARIWAPRLMVASSVLVLCFIPLMIIEAIRMSSERGENPDADALPRTPD